MKIAGAIITLCGLAAGSAVAQPAPPSPKAQDRIAQTGGSPIGQQRPATAVVIPSKTVSPVVQLTADTEIVRPSSAVDTCPHEVALSVEAAKSLVLRIATEENFYPEFVLSVAKIESGFVSTAHSGKGGYGLMQLSVEIARRFKVDRCDPAGNVRGGIRHLRILHARYRNPFFILAAWSAGEPALSKHRGIPPFPETARFIADVMNDFYDWPALGRSGVAEQGANGRGVVAASAPLTRSNPSQPPSSPAVAPWADGFVMHIQ